MSSNSIDHSVVQQLPYQPVSIQDILGVHGGAPGGELARLLTEAGWYQRSHPPSPRPQSQMVVAARLGQPRPRHHRSMGRRTHQRAAHRGENPLQATPPTAPVAHR